MRKWIDQNENRGLRNAFAAALLILTGSLIGTIMVLRKPDSCVVEIVQDDKVLYRLNPAEEEDHTFVISCGEGSNTICLEGGTIRISEADCPDQTCVNMGILRADKLPIVCLPHRLIVRFAEE